MTAIDRGVTSARDDVQGDTQPDGGYDDPLERFRSWREKWAAAGPVDDAAAVLATADHHGRPSARVIDVASVDHGFVFFTNHASRKASDLVVNPRAELCFSWLNIGRQLRAFGSVHRITDVESDAFFAGLPRRVALLAWVSNQRQHLQEPNELHDRLAAAQERFASQEIPRPLHWGGYRLIPLEFEFWQERRDGLHDRLRFGRERQDADWRIQQIAP